jgi:site-specific recombinase XerD
VTSHLLRHTFGTELVRGVVDLVTVAELMGHTVSSTELATAALRPAPGDQ